jgi:xylan 1,4-beta-xylosidase
MSSAPSSRRPIIAGFYPDPSICRVGADFYVANSSFEYFPGVPLWHSRDLLTWNPIGHVITRPSQFAAGSYRPSMGVYAPTLRHHEGTFYLITTFVEGPAGHALMKSSDPAGPWSDPVWVKGLDGFDPDIAWAEDGTCLVTYCAIQDWIPQGIHQAAINPGSGEVLEAPRLIWPGSGLQWPEGPHIHRRGDWWYLVIAEGGTERGHVVTVARARTPYGPFEGAPHNPIFTHRSTDHSVENVGHADLFDREDGSWAAVYLGVRTVGWVPRQHVNGRETFVAGIEWRDDWPVFVEDHFEVPGPTHAFATDFAEGLDHARWISPGLPIDSFTQPEPRGGVSLRPAVGPAGTMSGLFTRTRDLEWRASIGLELDGGEVDVVLRMDERHWYAVRAGGAGAAAISRVGDVEHAEPRVPAGDAVTVIVAAEPATHRGPDDVVLSVKTEGAITELARWDGRYLSSEIAGGFTGRALGVVARSGAPRVVSISYEPAETA